MRSPIRTNSSSSAGADPISVGIVPTSPGASPAEVTSLLAQATQLLKAGRPGDAVTPLREAARRLPGNAAILHDLGLACLESGRIGDAINALQSSVAIDANFQDSHLRLGIALEMAGAVEPALLAYHRAAEPSPLPESSNRATQSKPLPESSNRAAQSNPPRESSHRAAQLNPLLPEATYRAANLLDNLGHTARAIDMFRRAAAAAQGTTLGRLAMARALLAENRDAEAEKVLRKLLATEPDNAVALDLLANTLADAGRFADARRYFLRGIEKAPWLAGSYYDVVRCGRITDDDAELLARMRSAVESQTLEAAQRVRVHLALGKAADDLGDYEEAMRQFDAAERVRNGIAKFDLAKFEARVDSLIAHFTPELFARARQSARASRDDVAPILVCGLPRSGTTLVEQILSAHPDVRAGGELSFWNERGSAWERAGSAEAKTKQLAESAADYAHLLRDLARGGATRVTDKMPFNFQWAGLLHLAFPRATLIHCRRNPIDTALSIHQTHFNPRMLFPTGGATLVGYMRAYQRLCAHWRAVLPPERFIEIDYEALVDEPEPVVRRILEASGLTWSAACLAPERNIRTVKTPSKWQARQPIYRTAVDRWRVYETWLGPLRALLD
jgi:tetratricopeptide (TPR) repeat protein